MEERILLEATLCFPITDTQMLLGRKIQSIGAGLWNGFGGAVEPGENASACAIRELQEESGLEAKVTDLIKVGTAHFHNRTGDGRQFTCTVHLFFLRTWLGTAQPSAEMSTPTWFDRSNLPLEEMMLADRIWLPKLAEGKYLFVEAWYGPKQKTLEREVVTEFQTEASID